ncbi:Serine/threonine-protein kinase [Rhizoclosmatium sp. JEL0117]|nr:Serine/threonine-protein kinase [Rhizoclosmatium sp. JEL0117]
MRDIRHDNIVALRDIVKTDKHIHLIMDFCSLGDLSQYIKKKGAVLPYAAPKDTPLPTVNLSSPWGGINEAIVRHFLAQLASALETLRSLSLIHRDLKPQNLLLDPPPPSAPPITILSPFLNAPPFTIPPLPTLKLADFGFARALPSQSLASTLCGSPLYMAPEILRGDRYDAKVDLWSLGTILYEMITGRPPYKAQNHIDLLRKIDKGEGWIKFPGDEEVPPNQSTSSTNPSLPPPSAPAATAGGPLNSLGRRVMVPHFSTAHASSAATAASLGASPKFPQPGQPGMIGVRPISADLKDLTRRLLKRNPFERMSFEEFFMHIAVVEGASKIDVGGSVVTDPAVSSSHNAAESQQPHQQQQEQQVSEAPKQSEANAPQLPSTRSRLQPFVNPDPSSTPFPPSSPVKPIFSASLPANPKPVPLYHYVPSTTKASGHQPQQVLDQTDALFADLEPPFPGYDLDPSPHFGDLLVSPVSKPSSTKQQQQNPPSKHKSAAKQSPKDELSSSEISSLGSLELSDEIDPDHNKHGKQPTTATSNQRKQPTNSKKSPTRTDAFDDDFEMIDNDTPKPTQVNWLNNAEGSDGIMEAMGTRGVIPPPGSLFSKRSVGDKIGGGISASPPASPFTKKLTSESLKGSRSFDRSSPAPIIGSAGSGSGVTGVLHEQPRVFGSLRDSAHTAFLAEHHHHRPQPSIPQTTEDPVQHLLTVLNLATLRGHALHTFADEMHKQLVLSAENRVQEVPEEHRNDHHPAIQEETPSHMTPSAVARQETSVLAEETLSIYLATLRLYQYGLESAKTLWTRDQQQTGTVDVQSLTASVQWMREKFEDCLDRAQEVKGVIGPTGMDDQNSPTGGGITPRSLDKLVYARSLEVCRAASQAEASGSLQSAEVGYTHAIHLLEAILYAPPVSLSGSLMDSVETEMGISETERGALERFLVTIGRQVAKLRDVGTHSGGVSAGSM